jgi:hypothetical protein
MPLARFDAPFEHPGWIFEPKSDGFRPVAYVEGGTCRMVSRNRNGSCNGSIEIITVGGVRANVPVGRTVPSW